MKAATFILQFLITGLFPVGHAQPKPLILYTQNCGKLSYSTRGQPYKHSREWIFGTAVSFVQDLLHLSGVDYRLKLRQWSVGC